VPVIQCARLARRGGVRSGPGGVRATVRRKAIWALGLTASALLLAACAPHASQSTLRPAGPTAAEEKNLFMPVFWVAVGVFVLVEGGIVYIALKYRQRRGRERMPRQTHGNTRLEIGWTIAPALVLAVVMVPTVSLIWKLAKPAPPGAMHVTVEGFQWWWGFQYTDPDMKVDYGTNPGPITVADVLVVPAGRTVYLSLESQGGGAHSSNGTPDYVVIHSFWVPQLFGKQDVVPGRTNHITFSAWQPGTYTGQCAEFCGLEHGRMKLKVVALDQTDWNAWVADEKQGGVPPTEALAKQGEQIFLNPLSNDRGTCVACHAVGGTAASGTAAPNLTHFGNPDHECFAGCNWNVYNADGSPNTKDLSAWLRDPNAVKLGAKMPNYHLSQDEIDALMAYLYSLK
jgi:cytochrome c oxidase subunit II